MARAYVETGHRASQGALSLVALLVAAIVLSGCGAMHASAPPYGPRANNYLRSIVLTSKDLPLYPTTAFTGWKTYHATDAVPMLCPKVDLSKSSGTGYVSTELVPIPNFGPEVQEQILETNSAATEYVQIRHEISSCRTFTVVVGSGPYSSLAIHPAPIFLQAHMTLMPSWRFGPKSFGAVEVSPMGDDVTQVTGSSCDENASESQRVESAVILKGNLIVVVSVALTSCDVSEASLALYVTPALRRIS